MRSIDRRAELASQIAVQLGRIAAGARHDLHGEQVHDDPVLVGRPDRAVAPQKRRPRALFAAKAQRSVEQAGHEPLESDRHFDQRSRPTLAATRSMTLLLTTVLPTAASARQSRPMGEEIENRRGEVVVGIHQAGAAA